MNEPHSLAVVVAHPDDDAYGCAGSIALHENDPRFRFCLALATDGGAGQIAEGVPTTPDVLGAWRRRESANAGPASRQPPAYRSFPKGFDRVRPACLTMKEVAILKPLAWTFEPFFLFGGPL
jgi:LmbE family N-acetylglucosaminyl deacetylase